MGRPTISIAILSEKSDSRASKVTAMVKSVAKKMGLKVIVETRQLRNFVPDYWVPKTNTKSSYQIGPNSGPDFERVFGSMIADRFDAVLSIEMASLWHIAPDVAKHCKNLLKPAGSLLEYQGIPCMWLADPKDTYMSYLAEEDRACNMRTSLMHITRLLNTVVHGRFYNMDPMKFTIVTDPNELHHAIELANNSLLMSYDIETSGPLITCIGFTLLSRDMKSCTFVVPLSTNSGPDDGAYWRDINDHLLCFELLARLFDTSVPKVPHNGGYDNSHLLRHHLVPRNNVFDTQHAMHATWVTMRKALNFTASLFNAEYVFWKDDAKETGEDGKVIHGMPSNPDGLFRYWKYNAQDCHATAWAAANILFHWSGSRYDMTVPLGVPATYAPLNFVREFMLQMGPCLYMGMTGFKADVARQFAITEQFHKESQEELKRLRYIAADDKFNPNSPDQVATLFYDTWGMKQLPKKGRSTDQKILENFGERHPIMHELVQSIFGVKKPRNNASKYGKSGLLYNGRFIFNIKASGTVTGRFSGSSSNMFTGTNPQNIPAPVRSMFVAEDNHVILAADYSQSDSYFVAFESGDPVMIETTLDDRDTHAVHVEALLGYDYETVVRGKAMSEDWVVDPITGVRQIIKKVVHGTNYGMMGATMLVNSGRRAIVAAAVSLLQTEYRQAFCLFLGLPHDREHSPENWTRTQLEDTCSFLQKLYYNRYASYTRWRDAAVKHATMDGHMATSFGPYTVVTQASPSKQERFFASFFGQGGTAGNINNSLLRLFYLADDIWQEGFFLCVQVHDENIGQIPDTKLWLADRVVNIMSAECTIRDRRFVVPVEADIARTWTKAGVPWTGAHDAEVKMKGKVYPNYAAALAAHEEKLVSKLGLI